MIAVLFWIFVIFQCLLWYPTLPSAGQGWLTMITIFSFVMIIVKMFKGSRDDDSDR